MANNDGENKDKPYDGLGELLKKYYKVDNFIDSQEFWEDVSGKIESLFHKEIFSEKVVGSNGELLSDEERYWLGLEEYIKNETPSLKHKVVTDHLLICKQCRHNYNDLLDKKKVIFNNLVLT
ncbi:MAG: hypothetical protein HYY52_06920 [Candidatus Melainabacteria bacterium]|nr:hypothetical protein [Candidatus Melainabacteria bacterium]